MSILPPECNCDKPWRMDGPCPIHGAIGKERYEELESLEQPEHSKSDVQCLVRWHCDGCRAELKAEDVQKYGDGYGYCHTVVWPVGDGEWEPQPCGPVRMEAAKVT